MAYAYLDREGILHVNEDKETALKYAASKTMNRVVETNIEHEGGYPVILGNQVVYYAHDKAYIHGNKQNGQEIAIQPELKELVDRLN